MCILRIVRVRMEPCHPEKSIIQENGHDLQLEDDGEMEIDGEIIKNVFHTKPLSQFFGKSKNYHVLSYFTSLRLPMY